jgi:hypothetical protein
MENQFLAEASDGRWYIVGTAHLTSLLAKPARLAAGGCWRGGANINQDKIRIASYHSRKLLLFLVMNWTLLANSHFIWSDYLLVIYFLVFTIVCNHCYSPIAAIVHCTSNLCPFFLGVCFFPFLWHIFFLHFAHWLWTNSVLFSNLHVMGILVCNLEDVVGVFPHHVPEQLLMATCASHVVVGPVSSGLASTTSTFSLNYTSLVSSVDSLLPFLRALWYHGWRFRALPCAIVQWMSCK